MLELPECLTIARQLNEVLPGRVISRASRGNSPHRFAFFKPSVEEIEKQLPGCRVRDVSADGKAIFLRLDRGLVLLLRELDARVHWCAPGQPAQPAAAGQPSPADIAPPPKKYQFLVEFERGGHLTVTISLWGFIGLEKAGGAPKVPGQGPPPHEEKGLDPLGEEFTLERFRLLFDEYEKQLAPIKAFLINRPRIRGFGNAYMQEMLFRAGILPTRKVAELGPADQGRLHRAIREILKEAIRLGGSEDERDIYGRAGGYRKNLCARVESCKVCGTAIEKKSFLGGATYYCPRCQT